MGMERELFIGTVVIRNKKRRNMCSPLCSPNFNVTELFDKSKNMPVSPIPTNRRNFISSIAVGSFYPAPFSFQDSTFQSENPNVKEEQKLCFNCKSYKNVQAFHNIYAYQIITLYTLSLRNVIGQLYPNNTGKKKKKDSGLFADRFLGMCDVAAPKIYETSGYSHRNEGLGKMEVTFLSASGFGMLRPLLGLEACPQETVPLG